MEQPVVSSLNKGMNTDLSPEQLLQGHHTFALNAIDEGDNELGILANEKSSEIVLNIPNRIIIGKQVLDPTTICFFLVSEDDSISEIALFDTENNNLSIEVSDENSKNKLTFKKHHWIDTTYRNRRGCLRTIYFTDGYNKPRKYCFDTPDDYRLKSGDLNLNAFNFNKEISLIPKLDINVIKGGSLKAGQYFVGIQYSNKEFSESDWMSLTEGIIIYNSNTENPLSVSGDIYGETDSTKETTKQSDKSIQVKVSDIDTSMLFYRLCFIYYQKEHNPEVFVSELISVNSDTYILSSTSPLKETTLSDIIVDSPKIKSALTIDQHTNRLVLGNIKEETYDYSILQSSASKILSSCYIKEVRADINYDYNSANPVHKLNEGVGYQPGELYSFGIVYVFSDGTNSPVFHIPGATDNYPKINELGFYNMSLDNKMAYNYTSLSGDFYNSDYLGNSLENTSVRHHRFPSRRALDKLVVDIKYPYNNTNQSNSLEGFSIDLVLDISPKEEDNILTHFLCELYEVEYIDKEDVYTYNFSKHSLYSKYFDIEYPEEDNKSLHIIIPNKELYYKSNKPIVIKFTTYKKDKIVESFVVEPFLVDNGKSYNKKILEKKGLLNTSIIDFIDSNYTKSFKENGITEVKVYYDSDIPNNTTDSKLFPITTYNLGIHFYNVEKPSVPGKEIIGYFFVRNQREISDMNIKDSFIMFPNISSDNNKYEASSLLVPEFISDKPNTSNNKDSVKNLRQSVSSFAAPYPSRQSFALVSPRNKFLKEEPNFSELRIIGEYYFPEDSYEKLGDNLYRPKGRKHGYFTEQDVLKGTTYNSEVHEYKDDDGWTLQVFTRNNYLNYRNFDRDIIISKSSIKSFDSLESFGYLENNDKNKFYYNLSIDNKVLALRLKEDLPQNINLEDRVLYGYYYQHNTNAYSDFSNRPYYKISKHVYYFKDNLPSEEKVDFVGDTYTSPISYTSHFLYDLRAASRNAKGKGWLERIASALAIIGGILISVFSFGTLAIVGGILISAGATVLLASSELKHSNFVKALNEEYVKGLRYTMNDLFIGRFLKGLNGYSLSYSQEKRFKIPYLFKIFNKGEWWDSGCFPTTVIYNNKKYNPAFDINNHPDVLQAGEDGFDDDSIIWIAECLSNIFFESTINTYIRVPLYDATVPSYLGIVPYEDSQDRYIKLSTRKKAEGSDYDKDVYWEDTREPVGAFNRNSYQKLVYYDVKENKRLYRSLALADYYSVNSAYNEIHIKPYFSLDITKTVVTDCDNCFPHRILWSNISREEEYEDNYLKFLANNYKDISSDTGEITHVLALRDGIYIHTEYAFYKQPLNYQERVDNDFVTYIGTGAFAALPEQKFITSSNGLSAGLKHLTQSINCQAGYFFIGNDERSIYHFNSNLDIISNKGMYKFFDKHINNQTYYSWLPDEEGFSLGFDPKLQRALITKQKEFTLSYSLKTNTFTSFHSYLPNIYADINYTLLSFNANSKNLSKHNIGDTYTIYENKEYPFIVEYVSSNNAVTTKYTDNIYLNTRAIKYKEGSSFEDKYITFNKALFYNSTQCSGYMDLLYKQDDTNTNYMLSQISNTSNNNLDRNERDWSINGIRDNVIEYNKPLFINNKQIIYSDKELNVSINTNKSWNEKEMLRDKYLVCRYILDNNHDINLLYKYEINYSNTSVR